MDFEQKINFLNQPETQHFIAQNADKEVNLLVLNNKKYSKEEIQIIAQQIEGRKRLLKKIPLWQSFSTLIYPPTLSTEQASSWTTAQWKAQFLQSFNSLLDLTGGIGIDCFAFAKTIKQVYYNESQAELNQTVQYNFKLLGIENVAFYQQDAQTLLQNTTQTFDCLYADPARRDEANHKIVQLQDCQPNIIQLLPIIFSRTTHFLLKTSPMLDIQQAVSQLKAVDTVFILAINNEVKELLFWLKKDTPQNNTSYNIQTLHWHHQQLDTLTAPSDIEKEQNTTYSSPLQYLYEPNAAILKAGWFKWIAQHYQLHKLDPNTHLYTSDTLHKDFQGRIFQIKKKVAYQKKELHTHLPELKANIATRNFPDSVATFRKKMNLKEGGNLYLWGIKTEGKVQVLITEKVSIS